MARTYKIGHPRISKFPLTKRQRAERRCRHLENVAHGAFGSFAFFDASLKAALVETMSSAVFNAAAAVYGPHLQDDYYKTFAQLNFTRNQLGMLIDGIADRLAQHNPAITLLVEGAFRDPANPTETYQAFLADLLANATLGAMIGTITTLAH